jgi:hypothetical protein
MLPDICVGPDVPADYKTIVEKASEKLEFKEALSNCLNDPMTVKTLQFLREANEEDLFNLKTDK